MIGIVQLMIVRLADCKRESQRLRGRVKKLEAEWDALRELLDDVVWQFGYQGVKSGRRVIHTGGLSTLESVFLALGLEDPYVVPEDAPGGCDYPGCPQWSHMGTPTPDGYRHFCGKRHRDAYLNIGRGRKREKARYPED